MKLTKGQIEALADEVVERLSNVDVLSIRNSKLKTEWEKIQELHEKIQAKEKEVEAAQEIVSGLEDEQHDLEESMVKSKAAIQVKYGVKVEKEYIEDADENHVILKLRSNLGGGIHAKLQRQITLLGIDENIDGLTADQIIDKIVQKNLDQQHHEA